ncbi:MAG: hypothetical protein RR447_08630, partial [Algoriella sp.]
NKVAYSLFWFTNLNPIDNTALQYLITGNKEKAIEIWDKLTDEKEVTSKNFSAFNNIGTLYLLEGSKEETKSGVSAKIKLIESENFKDFVHTVADQTFSIDKNKQIELFIDELLMQFKNKYSTSETMELFSNCNGTIKKYLSKKFTEEPIHKIETLIEQFTKKRAKNKSNAYKFGTDLYSNTKNELTLLKYIVGNANLQYKMLADNVAKEILQCSIDYFNESQEQEKSGNYLEEAMKLVKLAESVAVNDTTKNKVKENISTLEGMKDRELNQAIEVLKSIKSAYDKASKEIDAEVEKLQYDDYGNGLSLPKFNVSINWSKVNEMKQKSLDWNKVVELIREAIPLRNVEKIKISTQSIKIEEYKLLVDFVISKLNNNQKNQVKYICYWKTITTRSNGSNEKKPLPISSDFSDNEGVFFAVGKLIGKYWWVIFLIVILISLFSFSSGDYKEQGGDSLIESEYNDGINSNMYEYENESFGDSYNSDSNNEEGSYNYENEYDNEEIDEYSN